MAITFNCHHCGKPLTTNDDKAGLKAKCPGCGEVVTVPEPEQTGGAAEAPAESWDEPEAGEPAPLRASRREPTTICPICGAENSVDAESCQACGEELEAAASQRRSEARPQVIDVGDVLSASWKIYQRSWPVLLGMALLVIGIGVMTYVGLVAMFIAVGVSLDAGRPGNDPEPVILLLLFPVSLVLGFLFSGLNAGVNRLLLATARGEEATIGLMFSGARFAWRAFFIGFLFNVMTTLGIYCLIFPGVLLWLMFWPYLYLIVDEDCASIESLSRAAKITAHNWLPVFLLCLVDFVLSLAASMTCVGVPIAMSFTWLTYAVAYCKMTDQRTDE